MTIPFKVQLLTDTAKAPEVAHEGDLFDLFADSFCVEHLKDCNISSYRKNAITKRGKMNSFLRGDSIELKPQGRILIKTGISIELPRNITYYNTPNCSRWRFDSDLDSDFYDINQYAVADIRPRSGLALKHGITVLNSPGTIDNSYRREIGVILINHGHEPYLITKGDKIAQMLIRELKPSSFEIVDTIEDTGRGACGSTGK